MSRKTKKGRSVSGPPFIALPIYIYECPAWNSLSATERLIWLALVRRYNGKNNGRLGLSVRDAAKEARVNKDTAGQHFKTLAARGFIEVAEESCLETRMAREWRLTHLKCDRTNHLPSKAFMKWTPVEVAPANENLTAPQTKVSKAA